MNNCKNNRNDEFKGKVALVTGAGSGMGRATALLFSYKGAHVVVADIVADAGLETEAMIKATGGKGFFVQADMSRLEDIKTMVDAVVEKFGRLDIAVNNAAVTDVMALTADQTEADWERMMSINLTGVWRCMKYEIRQMLKTGSGAIVNISSLAGYMAVPQMSSYVASKHGVIGLTKTAALEYAENNIRINAVCPGFIDTPAVRTTPEKFRKANVAKTPLKRMGHPEEVAEATVWLCSDSASFVVGQVITVDGGLSIY